MAYDLDEFLGAPAPATSAAPVAVADPVDAFLSAPVATAPQGDVIQALVEDRANFNPEQFLGERIAAGGEIDPLDFQLAEEVYHRRAEQPLTAGRVAGAVVPLAKGFADTATSFGRGLGQVAANVPDAAGLTADGATQEKAQTKVTAGLQTGEEGAKGFVDRLFGTDSWFGRAMDITKKLRTDDGEMSMDAPEGQVQAAITSQQTAEDLQDTPENRRARSNRVLRERAEEAARMLKLSQGKVQDTGLVGGAIGLSGTPASETLASPERLAESGLPWTPQDTQDVSDIGTVADLSNLVPFHVPVAGALARKGMGGAMEIVGAGLEKIGKRAEDAAARAARSRLGSTAGIAGAMVDPVSTAGVAATGAGIWGGGKISQGIGRVLRETGEEARTSKPGALSARIGEAELKGVGAKADKARRFVGDTILETGSAPLAEAPINALISNDIEEFAEQTGGAAGMGAISGGRFRFRPEKAAGVASFLQQEGAKPTGDETLDAKHDAFMAKASPEVRDGINGLRGLFGGMAGRAPTSGATTTNRIYVMEGGDFAAEARRINPDLANVSDAELAQQRGVFDPNTGIALINGSHGENLTAGEIGHTAGHEVGGHATENVLRLMSEQGHPLDAYMKESLRDGLFDASGAPTPEFLGFVEAYKANAPEAIKNLPATDPYFANEFLAETAAQVLSEKGVGELTLPQGLTDKLIQNVGSAWSRMLGMDPNELTGGTKFDRKQVGALNQAMGDLIGQIGRLKFRTDKLDPSKTPAGTPTPEATTPSPDDSTPSTPAEGARQVHVQGGLMRAGGKPMSDRERAAKQAQLASEWDDLLADYDNYADEQGITPPTDPTELHQAVLAHALGANAPKVAPVPSSFTPAAGSVAPQGDLASVGAEPPPGKRVSQIIDNGQVVDQVLVDEPKPIVKGRKPKGDLAPKPAEKPRVRMFRDPADGVWKPRPDQPRPEPVIRTSDVDPGRTPEPIESDRVSQVSQESQARPALRKTDQEKVDFLEQNIGQTVYLDYNSAEKEVQGDGGLDVTGKQRAKELRANDAQSRIAAKGGDGLSVSGIEQDKAFVPFGVKVSPTTGAVTVTGFSVNKLVSNMKKLLDFAKEAKIPVGYSGVNDPQLIKDAQAYAQNHAHGYKGDGSGPLKMEGMVTDPTYSPVRIPKDRFDVLNTAFADERAKMDTERGQELRDIAKENQGFLSPQGEVNEFRNAVNKSGKFTFVNQAGAERKGTAEILETVVETLRPELITNPRKEALKSPVSIRETGFKGDLSGFAKAGLPKNKAVGAGFLPAEGKRDLPIGKLPKYKSLWIDRSGNLKGAMREQAHSDLLSSMGGKKEGDLARGSVRGDTLHIDGKGITAPQRRAIEDFAESHGLKTNFADRSARMQGSAFMPKSGKKKGDLGDLVTGKEREKNFEKWTGGAPVYRLGDSLWDLESGQPVVIEGVHGTTHTITEFDVSRTSPENDFGRGIYISNTPEDVAANYAGEGPDLTARIEKRAEDLMSEIESMGVEEAMEAFPGLTQKEYNLIANQGDYSFSSPKFKEVEKVTTRLAKKELTSHGGATMRVFVKLQNPLKLGGEEEYWYMGEYNEETDEQTPGKIDEFIQALRDEASRYDDAEIDEDEISNLSEGATPSQAIQAARKAIPYATDPDSNYAQASSEIIRAAIERMGYDGIVDGTVDEKFGSQRRTGKSMKGMHEDTFHIIAFDQASIKSATGNQGTFDPQNKDIRFMPSEGGDLATSIKSKSPKSGEEFYSTLRRVVAEKLPNKASAAQIRATLDPQKSGIRKEELDWMGIDQFLEGKESVSKADLLEFIDSNRVELQTVRKQPIGDFDLEKEGYTVDLDEEQGYILRDPDGRIIDGDYSSQEEAEQTAYEYWEADKEKSLPKFQQYKLPGGENYQEVLLTLPERSKGLPAGYSVKETGDGGRYAWAIFDADGLQVSGTVAATKEAAMENAGKVRDSNELKPDDFRSSHWDEANVVAHIRQQDFQDADGNRVRVIEEIQSDWHQKGRKNGYAGNPSREARIALGKEEAKRIGFSDEEVARLSDDDALKFAHPKVDAVPDGPFKKSWHELAFKKALRDAVESGADKLAWVTGEIAADRFDISKQVDEVRYDSYGTFTATKGGETVISKPNVKPEELEALIGKDVAQRLIDAPESRIPARKGTQKVISGEALKVGGSGMKGFYDKILPDYVRKYVKKWNSTVETVEIPTETQNGGRIERAWSDANNAYIYRVRANGVIAETFKTLKEAEDYTEKASTKTETLHAVAITPQMRESVRQGQPLFMPQTGEKNAQGDLATFGKKSGTGKVGSYDPNTGSVRLMPGVKGDEKSLTAVHNLSLNNLRHAIEVGGLAVPSMAIIRTDRSAFDSFGEVTLVAHPDLIDPQKNRDSKVFNADVYSPRYPTVKTFLKEPDQKKLANFLKQFREELPEDAGWTWSVGSVIEGIGENGFTERSALVRYAYARDTGLLDTLKTEQERNLHSVVAESVDGKGEEIAAWFRNKVEELGIQPEEKIFNGFTNSGNRRYLPHNLDTVVKLMKKGLRGGEGFNYGVPSIRAKMAKQYKSIKSLQGDRESIIPKEEMEAIKAEVNAEFEALEEKFGRGGSMDQFADDMIAIAEGGSKNWQYLREQYPQGIPQEMRAFLEKLKYLPTEYFEAKIHRAVQLQEFAGAVVPEDSPESVIKRLEKSGLSVETYKAGDAKSRQEAVHKVSSEARALFMPASTPQPVAFMPADNREPIRVDEHGKNITWELGAHSIAVDDTQSPSYITLWRGGKKVGALSTRTHPGQRDWVGISSVEIDKPERGKGLGTQMYRELLRFIPDTKKGISTYLPDQANKKQVPRIYRRLGGYVDGDYGFIPRGPSASFMPASKPQPESEAKDNEKRISTRQPWSPKSKEDASTGQLVVGADPIINSADKVYLKKIAEAIKSYGYIKKGKSPRAAMENLISHVEENLLWLHDRFPQDIRETSALWYDGARKISEEWSETYGVPRQAVAGAIAALSPQADWFQNISRAKRVIEIMQAHQNSMVTPEIVKQAKFRSPSNPTFPTIVEGMKGRAFKDMTLPEKALFIRLYDEANNSKDYPMLSPDGTVLGLAKNKDGSNTSMSWFSLDPIAKAISSIEDPSPANISRMMGDAHKVRNFYNNILLPNGAWGDVTMDTHAVAAGLLIPLAGGDIEVVHNLSGPPANSLTGSIGFYGLYAEAYRRAAEARGILPRQMQSITWEAVRGLFTAEWKSKKNKEAVREIWKQAARGEITNEQAREQIEEYAGGINRPDWAAVSDAGSPEGSRDPRNQGELSERSLRGKSAKGTKLGGGAGSSRGAAKATKRGDLASFRR